MTYIKRNRAHVINAELEDVVSKLYNPQELAYAVTKLASMYVHKRGSASYENISSALGAIEDAAEEFHEHLVKPFIRRGGRIKSHITPQEVYGP